MRRSLSVCYKFSMKSTPPHFLVIPCVQDCRLYCCLVLRGREQLAAVVTLFTEPDELITSCFCLHVFASRHFTLFSQHGSMLNLDRCFGRRQKPTKMSIMLLQAAVNYPLFSTRNPGLSQRYSELECSIRKDFLGLAAVSASHCKFDVAVTGVSYCQNTLECVLPFNANFFGLLGKREKLYQGTRK